MATRARELYREERFAMACWHEDYASQPGSAIDFYRSLSPEAKRLVDTLVKEIVEAKPIPKGRYGD